MFKWLRQTDGTDRGSVHPSPSAPPEDQFSKLIEKVSTMGEGQSALGRALAKVLTRVESIQSQTQSDFATLHQEILRLSAPLEALFSLADTLNQLDEQLRQPGICLFSAEELTATPLGKLAAQATGDEPNTRAQDMRRVLASAFSQLDRYLALHGVTRIGVPGQRLDAHGLRAVDVIDTEEFPAGTIASVIRCGFLRGAKVLREGDVVVYRRLQPAPEPIEPEYSLPEQGDRPVQPAQSREAPDMPVLRSVEALAANGHNAVEGGPSGIEGMGN